MAGFGTIPKPHAENLTEIGDFIEIECLRRADRNVSVLDVTRIIERESDRISQDVVMQLVRDSVGDLENRASHSGSAGAQYPFSFDTSGDLVQFTESADERDWCIYLFLLLATRLDMKSSRRHSGEDASVLFEMLCCEVGKRLWGGAEDSRVKAFVFGTARQADGKRDDEELDIDSFSAAVNHLCVELNEGVEFDPKSKGRVTARDGKLDVVVWRSFSDRRDGQMIAFGQCKTGTNWDSDLGKLRPEDFFSKWVRQHPAVLPLRLYFIADRAVHRWYDRSKDGGVLLDRCRIMEYCSNLPADLLKRIRNWVTAAAKSHGLLVS